MAFLPSLPGQEQVNYTICNAGRQEKLRTWKQVRRKTNGLIVLSKDRINFRE